MLVSLVSENLLGFTCVVSLMFNTIQDGPFRGCPRMGVQKSPPLPKFLHTYPTMMRLGTVILYLRNIQDI